MDVFKKFHINLPFAETLLHMPKYAKFMKELCTNKKKLEGIGTVQLSCNYIAILTNKILEKLKDPGSITLPCELGGNFIGHDLCDLGASINVMPYSI